MLKTCKQFPHKKTKYKSEIKQKFGTNYGLKPQEEKRKVILSTQIKIKQPATMMQTKKQNPDKNFKNISMHHLPREKQQKKENTYIIGKVVNRRIQYNY